MAPKNRFNPVQSGYKDGKRYLEKRKGGYEVQLRATSQLLVKYDYHLL